MHTLTALPGNARTFLTHFFGSGLADEQYVAGRFESMVDADVRSLETDARDAKARRRTKRTVVPLRAVKETRPARNAIIVCAALNLKNTGFQYRRQSWADREEHAGARTRPAPTPPRYRPGPPS